MVNYNRKLFIRWVTEIPIVWTDQNKEEQREIVEAGKRRQFQWKEIEHDREMVKDVRA